MNDVTVSVTEQNVIVTPTVQRLTITVPFVDATGTAPISLNDLTDVTVTGAAAGYILRHDGTEFRSVPSNSYLAASTHTHAAADVVGLVAFQTATTNTLADHDDRIGSVETSILSLPTFGTAAGLNFNVAGDATSSQVVRGGDSRLTNARTPTSHTHAISDVTSLQTSLDGKAATAHSHSYSDITSGYPALTYAQLILSGGTVSVSNTAWTIIGLGTTSISLAAGTWFVTSTVTLSSSSTTQQVAIRIASTGGTVYASTEGTTPATASRDLSLSTSCVVVLGSATDVAHYARAGATGSTVQNATTSTTGSSANATIITAVRIA